MLLSLSWGERLRLSFQNATFLPALHHFFGIGQCRFGIHLIFLAEQAGQLLCVERFVLDGLPQLGGTFVQRNHLAKVDVFNA